MHYDLLTSYRLCSTCSASAGPVWISVRAIAVFVIVFARATWMLVGYW
jgi:hypothetical protein